MSVQQQRGWPDFSASVNTLLNQVDNNADGGTLLDIMRSLHSLHGEYASNYAVNNNIQSTNSNLLLDNIIYLENKETLINFRRMSADEWAVEISSILNKPASPPVINGRLFLIGSILSNFKDIYFQLQKDSQWQGLCQSLIYLLNSELIAQDKTNFNAILSDKGRSLLHGLEQPEEKPLTDVEADRLMYTNNLSDVPTKEDSLSRKALATYLANRLRLIYNRDIDEGRYGSFFMHIDGEWGSGKSTLLGFIEEELEKKASGDQKIDPGKKSQQEWIVVDFNAWENQRLDPPWWYLMKTVYQKSMDKLWKTNRSRWLKAGIAELLWRFNAGNNYLKVAALITLIIFLWSIRLGSLSIDGFKKIGLVEIATLLGFIWSFAKLVSSSLLPGSAKAAQSFIEEHGKDPMNELATHFEKMISRIESPVAIFIDDLDRCNRDYGVKLLEGLQTIFKRAPVVYVIAADRKWLTIMYEDQYRQFAPVIARPAKPFGLVFLDKIFQLIVELPDISAVQKKIYWNKLLNIDSPDQPKLSEAKKSQIRNEITSAATNATKLNTASQSDASPQEKQFAKEIAVSTVSIAEEERMLENKLQNFIELIEPNPRSMKRLINDVSTAKTITYLYNQNVETEQLILWTILKQEHPLLAEFFWDNPSKIREVTNTTESSGSITNVESYDQLLRNQKVKSLFKFSVNGKTLQLDEMFLNTMQFKPVPEKPGAAQKVKPSSVLQ